MGAVKLRPEGVDHIAHQVAPEIYHLRVLTGERQCKRMAPGRFVPVGVERGGDFELGLLIVFRFDDAIRLAAFQVYENVDQPDAGRSRF